MKEFKMSQIKNLKINGRTNGSLEPLTLFWTASGFEVNVTGSELWMEVEADYDSQEPWYSVFVNGEHMFRRMGEKGRSRVCIFRGRDENSIKNVRIVKDTQAQSSDDRALLQIISLSSDGEFSEVKERPYKLEVIGDSITSGEGLYGAKNDMEWISQFFSATRGYAFKTAEAIDADLSVISQSGWGAFASWDGKLECAIPPYYDEVCGLLNGERNISLGAKEEHDFSKWQPDAVVINLGTNDSSAYKTEGFGHELYELKDTVSEFLAEIRKHNPKARIVWIYGMFGNDMEPSILEGIREYKEQSKDDKVDYLRMPDTTPDMVGSRQHPGVAAHDIAAQILAGYLKTVL